MHPRCFGGLVALSLTWHHWGSEFKSCCQWYLSSTFVCQGWVLPTEAQRFWNFSFWDFSSLGKDLTHPLFGDLQRWDPVGHEPEGSPDEDETYSISERSACPRWCATLSVAYANELVMLCGSAQWQLTGQSFLSCFEVSQKCQCQALSILQPLIHLSKLVHLVCWCTSLCWKLRTRTAMDKVDNSGQAGLRLWYGYNFTLMFSARPETSLESLSSKRKSGLSWATIGCPEGHCQLVWTAHTVAHNLGLSEEFETPNTQQTNKYLQHHVMHPPNIFKIIQTLKFNFWKLPSLVQYHFPVATWRCIPAPSCSSAVGKHCYNSSCHWSASPDHSGHTEAKCSSSKPDHTSYPRFPLLDREVFGCSRSFRPRTLARSNGKWHVALPGLQPASRRETNPLPAMQTSRSRGCFERFRGQHTASWGCLPQTSSDVGSQTRACWCQCRAAQPNRRRQAHPER